MMLVQVYSETPMNGARMRPGHQLEDQRAAAGDEDDQERHRT